ncbi:43786_t:CDS:2 [Gigaspora margarita]|uniref:43786_t:CDS:1 n=1 Tax=Gigaspora margarita TaxID=4874 RepID=A0ABN7VSX7_GIGMA|nr:43786_t:CDS:2 [Gigaspora margarita]
MVLDTPYIFKRFNDSMPDQNCILEIDYQKPANSNQYKTCTSEIYSQKSNKIEKLEVEVDCQKQVEAIKNESKSFEVKLKDRVGVKNNVAKLAEVVEMIKPRFENSIENEKKTLIKYQESIKKEKVEDKKDLKKSNHSILVENDGKKNKINNIYKLKVLLEEEALYHACIEWNKKVDEF